MEKIEITEESIAETTPPPPDTQETVVTTDLQDTKPHFNSRIIWIALGATLLLGILAGIVYATRKNTDVQSDINPTPTPLASPTASLTDTDFPTSTPTRRPTSTRTPTPTPNPTNTPTPTPTNTPVPTPTRTPNPPVMRITFPTEGQTVTQSSSNICIVDIPDGGDTTGLNRKHKINTANWTSYVSMYTLCTTFPEGSNTISLQYKNSFGEESQVYTVNFTYQPQ